MIRDAEEGEPIGQPGKIGIAAPIGLFGIFEELRILARRFFKNGAAVAPMAECDRRPVNQIARLDRHTRIVGGHPRTEFLHPADAFMAEDNREGHNPGAAIGDMRSEEHTSELQSLMRISYAVFCLKKKI